jgi:hypothetical protein
VSRSFELLKVAFVQTLWQIVQPLFRVREESNIQVHPSGRRDNTVRTLFNVRQVTWFLSQTQIWEDSCNRPDDVCLGPDSILGPDVKLHGPDAQTLLWKLRAMEVQLDGH